MTVTDFVQAERRKDPDNFSLNFTSPIMVRAQKHAVKRLAAKDEKDLIIRKEGDGNLILPNQFQLPAPEGGSEHLASAVVSTSGSSSELTTVEQVSALAVAFFEDVSLGAISRAGALPMGHDGEWIKYAEDKCDFRSRCTSELTSSLGSKEMRNSTIKSSCGSLVRRLLRRTS